MIPRGGESWRFLDRHLAKGRVSLLFLWTIIQKPIQNHTQLKFCIFASIVISSTFPWNQDSPRKVVYFFDQSDSFLKLDFAPRIVPRNISSTKQKENFYDHIVHLLSKFPLCYFIRGFVLILRWKFVFEFVVCFDMIERVSPPLKYYVSIGRTAYALICKKTTLPVANTHIPLHYNTFKVIQWIFVKFWVIL